MPEVGALVSGPNVGEVTLQIKTAASGINSSLQNFQFIVTPVLDGRSLSSIQYYFPDYQLKWHARLYLCLFLNWRRESPTPFVLLQ